MSAFVSLEKALDDLFVKQLPPLPANIKKVIVQVLPWINLVLGLLTLYAVYVVWHWAHFANSLVNYANELSAAYGGTQIATNRMGVIIWLGLAVLAVEAVLYLAAFPATKNRKRIGWDLMFYAALLNLVYGVVMLFGSYGGVGNLFMSLIGTTIGFYFLFQIRASYTKHPAK